MALLSSRSSTKLLMKKQIMQSINNVFCCVLDQAAHPGLVFILVVRDN